MPQHHDRIRLKLVVQTKGLMAKPEAERDEGPHLGAEESDHLAAAAGSLRHTVQIAIICGTFSRQDAQDRVPRALSLAAELADAGCVKGGVPRGPPWPHTRRLPEGSRKASGATHQGPSSGLTLNSWERSEGPVRFRDPVKISVIEPPP